MAKPDLKEAAKRRLQFINGSDKSKVIKPTNIPNGGLGNPSDPAKVLPPFLRGKT